MDRQIYLITDVVMAPASLEEEAAGLVAFSLIVLVLLLTFLRIFQDFSVVQSCTLIAVLAQHLPRITRII